MDCLKKKRCNTSSKPHVNKTFIFSLSVPKNCKEVGFQGGIFESRGYDFEGKMYTGDNLSFKI